MPTPDTPQAVQAAEFEHIKAELAALEQQAVQAEPAPPAGAPGISFPELRARYADFRAGIHQDAVAVQELVKALDAFIAGLEQPA